MKKYLKIILPVSAVIVLLVPGYTFFIVNSNFSSAADFNSTLFMVFRLIGLYAFTLIWFQLILGPMMTPLSRLYGGKILRLHRLTGTFAFCLALTHGILFHLASFLSLGQNYGFLTSLENYVSPGVKQFYAFLGPAALTLLVATVTTALLMRKKHINTIWRKIHFLNYLVFMLVFLHSFNIGNDTQTEPLKSLYLFFLLTFLIAFYYRVIWRRFLS